MTHSNRGEVRDVSLGVVHEIIAAFPDAAEVAASSLNVNACQCEADGVGRWVVATNVTTWHALGDRNAPRPL